MCVMSVMVSRHGPCISRQTRSPRESPPQSSASSTSAVEGADLGAVTTPLEHPTRVLIGRLDRTDCGPSSTLRFTPRVVNRKTENTQSLTQERNELDASQDSHAKSTSSDCESSSDIDLPPRKFLRTRTHKVPLSPEEPLPSTQIRHGRNGFGTQERRVLTKPSPLTSIRHHKSHKKTPSRPGPRSWICLDISVGPLPDVLFLRAGESLRGPEMHGILPLAAEDETSDSVLFEYADGMEPPESAQRQPGSDNVCDASDRCQNSKTYIMNAASRIAEGPEHQSSPHRDATDEYPLQLKSTLLNAVSVLPSLKPQKADAGVTQVSRVDSPMKSDADGSIDKQHVTKQITTNREDNIDPADQVFALRYLGVGKDYVCPPSKQDHNNHVRHIDEATTLPTMQHRFDFEDQEEDLFDDVPSGIFYADVLERESKDHVLLSTSREISQGAPPATFNAQDSMCEEQVVTSVAAHMIYPAAIRDPHLKLNITAVEPQHSGVRPQSDDDYSFPSSADDAHEYMFLPDRPLPPPRLSGHAGSHVPAPRSAQDTYMSLVGQVVMPALEEVDEDEDEVPPSNQQQGLSQLHRDWGHYTGRTAPPFGRGQSPVDSMLRVLSSTRKPCLLIVGQRHDRMASPRRI